MQNSGDHVCTFSFEPHDNDNEKSSAYPIECSNANQLTLKDTKNDVDFLGHAADQHSCSTDAHLSASLNKQKSNLNEWSDCSAAISSSDRPSRGNYKYVLGVVNPLSGEQGAARFVEQSMQKLFGAERVVRLDRSLFADTTPLIEAICRYAVCFFSGEGDCDGDIPEAYCKGAIFSSNNNNESNCNNRENSTTNVSCGCNVSFVNQRGTVLVAGGDGTVAFVMEQLDIVRATVRRKITSTRTVKQINNQQELVGMRFLLPAVAVIALGTGNDYSNSLGFGSGYVKQKMCGLCCCLTNSVEPLIEDALLAPAVPFDRWTVRLVSLDVILEQNEAKRLNAGNSCCVQDKNKTNHTLLSSKDLVEGCDDNKDIDLSFLDWDELYASEKCVKYNFINYFSVGYDAYVLHKFDFFRKENPRICTKRGCNKLVYGIYGIKGAFRCSRLRKCISSIYCLNSSQFQNIPTNSNIISKSFLLKENIRHKTSVKLPLPKSCKTLIVSNISCYAAGTHLWNVNDRNYFNNNANQHDVFIDANAKAITSVSVNDRKVEVQAIGGFFDMCKLQLGLGKGAIKLAQTGEIHMFFLCTSEDVIHYMENKGRCSKKNCDNIKANTPLCLQVDGEPRGKIEKPTLLNITELKQPRLYVRCRNIRLISPSLSEVGTAISGLQT